MRYLTFLYILIFATSGVRGQVPFMKFVPVGDEDQNVQVKCVSLDLNGFLLLGTDKETYLYNGSTFKPAPWGANVSTLCIANENGKTLIGCADGSIMSLDKFHRYRTFCAASTTKAEVHDIEIVNDSTIIVATDTRGMLILVRDKVLLEFNKARGLSDDYVYKVCKLPDGRYVAATDHGLTFFSYEQQTIRKLIYRDQQTGLSDNICRAMAVDPTDSLIVVGGQQAGVSILDLRELKVSGTEHWSWGQVNDIVRIGKKRYWVTTQSGALVEVSVGSAGRLISEEVYRGESALGSLGADKTGNFWCGSTSGLIKFYSPDMRRVNVTTNFSLRELTAMAFIDTVLYYSLGRNIYKMPPGGVPLKWATTSDIVTAMYCDERKRLWIGTLGQGLLCATRSNSPLPVSCNSQLTSKQILSIAAIGDTIWVASLGGVDEIVASSASMECRHKKRHSKISGMGSDYVYQLYADRGNAMWIATDGAGGYRYKDGQYSNVTSGLGLREKVIYSITQGSDDAIWMATMKDGLLRYKNGDWRTYNKTSGLTDHNIYGLKTVRNGNILVLHKKGIDEYYPSSGCFRHYTRMLDMDIDSVSETLNCFAVDSRGVVYVPFEHGFISFSRSDFVPDLRSGIHISDILVFSKAIPIGKRAFEHDENSFTFKFDGVNFTNPDRLYFRYRLAGHNDDWVVTRDRAAVFPQLPPGKYTFVVQSSLTSDFSVPTQSTFEFLIAKPFWLRSWFLIMAGLIVTTVVLMVIRNRENKLRTRSKLERERHQYEYEYLKSQVNPHFLFNSLNTLVSLIDDNKNAATDYTINLSDFYRNLLTYNNVDSITLAEELGLLEKYVHIQKTRFGAALNVELQIAPVYLSAGKVVPMALQLLVENAIKHNVVSMSSPLHIVISAADGVLTVKNNIKAKVEKEKGAGLGLRNLRERYHLQGGKTVTTYIENGYFIVKLPL